MRKTLLYMVTLMAFASCGGRASEGASAQVPTDTITTFTLPEIPVMLTEPEQRLDYLTKHFWDNVNFCDTNYVHHPDVTEQAWADYISILPMLNDQAKIENALKVLFDNAAQQRTSYLYVKELAEQYLYDPNSPLRNEELYIPVLDILLSSSVLSENEKIRPRAQRELAEKNRPGRQAEDFTFRLANGEEKTLYGLEAPYVLLCINSPGCEACTAMISAIRSSFSIYEAMTSGLKVLSVYPDEDVEFWRQHLDEYPSNWIVAYDEGMKLTLERRYDLKALPTIYLLDADKKVLLKDTTVEAVNQYLSASKR